jgi:methylthioribose-1-phosphate isomerase
LIDQTKLPAELITIKVKTVQQLREAIVSLKVRGAPLLGAAGAYGCALAAFGSTFDDPEMLLEELDLAGDSLRSARPTAVNLSWGVRRALSAAKGHNSVHAIREAVLEEAKRIAEEDVAINRTIGRLGSRLIESGDRILTHCNAGRLACVDYGTALGVIRSAVEEGKKVSVYACETRPLFQGSRLTSWELSEDGIPVTLICDSASGLLMRRGMVDKVIVGADRITRDAVFNKVGTYTHAVLARAHKIPFYVAAPISTFDLEHVEREVKIEERDPDEVRRAGDLTISPPFVRAYNPAFDATPMELVTAIITEEGIFRPPEMPRVL